jgi:hypothetical protein
MSIPIERLLDALSRKPGFSISSFKFDLFVKRNLTCEYKYFIAVPTMVRNRREKFWNFP